MCSAETSPSAANRASSTCRRGRVRRPPSRRTAAATSSRSRNRNGLLRGATVMAQPSMVRADVLQTTRTRRIVPGGMRGLSRSEWTTLAGMAAVVVGLHVLGFFLLFAFVVPRHFELGGAGIFGVGIGITAYTLGMRHAFDADHIAAIDNTTRKLMADGQ